MPKDIGLDCIMTYLGDFFLGAGFFAARNSSTKPHKLGLENLIIPITIPIHAMNIH
jgi:hypothetical protein